MQTPFFLKDQAKNLLTQLDTFIEKEKVQPTAEELNNPFITHDYTDEDDVRRLYMRIKAMLGEFDNNTAFLEEIANLHKTNFSVRFGFNEKERAKLYREVLVNFIEHLDNFRIKTL